MKKPGTPASEAGSERGSAGVSGEGEAAGCLERGPCAAPSPGTASPEEPPLLPELRFDGRDAEGWLGVALWENCVPSTARIRAVPMVWWRQTSTVRIAPFPVREDPVIWCDKF